MKVAIIDDNKDVLNNLEQLLKDEEFGKCEIHTFTNTNKLEKVINNHLDIIFIDIKLENNNGIDFIKNNKEKLVNTNIVYITGYDDYMENIFETNPFYLLKKPITKEKLIKVFTKLNDKDNKKYLLLKNGKEIIRVSIKDILYIESFGRVVEFHLDKNEKLSFYNNISLLIDLLPSNFLRIHKSYIVNIDKIKTYNKKEITLLNGEIVPISRMKYNEVNLKIINYVKGI